MNDPFLDALTPLGFRVRVSRSRWEWIITMKHPAMTGRESDVKKALEKQKKSD